MKTPAKVLRYMKAYIAVFILSLVFAVASVILTLYVPILTGRAIDLITGMGEVSAQMTQILTILTSILLIVGITALIQWIMNICNNKMVYGVVRRIRRDAFVKIQSLPISYIDSHRSGEIISRVISDADTFADGLLMGFTQLFTGVVTIVATIVFMISINWQIALVVIFITPVSLLVAAFLAKRTHSMFVLQSKHRAEQTAFIDEMISGHKVVTAFGHEDETVEKFEEINERLRASSQRATFFSSLTNPSTRFVNSLVYAGVALSGALICISTSGIAISIGQLSCFLSYANQYTKPFNEISGVIAELQNAMVCASRLFDLIEEISEVPDSPDAKVLDDPEGNVSLENVSFSYTPSKPLIKDLNLSLKYGQRVAIVGPTGCGKTTVINLLMRFYDIDSGSLKVDDTDIRNITRNSLRASYGMVLQETWLKSCSVKDNIKMGKPDATDEEVIAAAKAAHAHSFIKRLPNGYDTVLEGNGDSLSQGQKQLLCIARVMLCLPPMLILDEATSSIDTRTELKIQNAFAKLMKGRTSFIVAHRLSTIKECDVILVMRDGNIVEQGSHDELLAANGFYATLYNSQF